MRLKVRSVVVGPLWRSGTLRGKTTGYPRKGMKHSYPKELASVLKKQWASVAPFTGDNAAEGSHASDPLPDLPALESLLSVCYQASLMRNEGRPITFRLFIREPALFKAQENPPSGLHRIVFSETRPFDENELAVLSCGVDFYRSLIGVSPDKTKGLQIWGLINSGSRWIQAVHGGRKASESLPPSLVVRVTGPGRLAVCRGSTTIATLNSGKISCPTADTLISRWLPARFKPTGGSAFELRCRIREIEEKFRATLDEILIETLIQQAYKRIVSLMRNLHHGGTLVLAPPEKASELASQNRYIDIRYKFIDEEPRFRLASLYHELMNTLAEEKAKQGIVGRPVEWNDYVASQNIAVERLDEAIFEAAHFIADLTAIDGAVVMTKSLELLGFGAEILGGSKKIETVARVLDTEGEHIEVESARRVGTRHRSAFRLCAELHDAVAIVVSQDGSVRIVTWKDNMVVYWDQVPVSVLDL